jgi:hypothetical protein
MWTWAGICSFRKGATVSDAAELEDSRPVVNFDNVDAWRLSPSGTAGGGSAEGAFVRDGSVEGGGVWVVAPRSGDRGDRGK